MSTYVFANSLPSIDDPSRLCGAVGRTRYEYNSPLRRGSITLKRLDLSTAYWVAAVEAAYWGGTAEESSRLMSPTESLTATAESCSGAFWNTA
jgi:hypothetical protein